MRVRCRFASVAIDTAILSLPLCAYGFRAFNRFTRFVQILTTEADLIVYHFARRFFDAVCYLSLNGWSVEIENIFDKNHFSEDLILY